MMDRYRRLTRPGKLIFLLSIWLLAAVVFSVIGVRTSHTLTLQLSVPAEQLTAVADDGEDIANILSYTVSGDRVTVEHRGSGTVLFSIEDEIVLLIRCLPNGMLYDECSGNFSGWPYVAGAVLGFLLAATATALLLTVRQLKQELYSDNSPLLIAVCIVMAAQLLLVVFSYPSGSFAAIANAASQLMQLLALITIPLMLLFTLAMFISNLALLRHEGPTWRNLLGSMIGFVLSAGLLFVNSGADFSGSETAYLWRTAGVNFLSGLVVWTECKLIGVMFCGLKAAHGKPDLDRDYVLILGCKLSSRGGLTPLLRGRVDRALAFRAEQIAATGKAPVLVPCGGQGKDERTTEAAAMRAYLLEKGIPDGEILCEDQSANTFQNMGNAAKLMGKGARVAYATTNYHVFRSGIWARKNGLTAQGMGSGTKWYYWPNAFMREYVALITANAAHEVLATLVIALSAALSVLLMAI